VVCDLGFYASSGFIEHKHKHDYGCSVCGKEFGRKSHLQDHMISHSDVRAFSCEICGKSYKHAKHLKRHQKLSHFNQELVT